MQEFLNPVNPELHIFIYSEARTIGPRVPSWCPEEVARAPTRYLLSHNFVVAVA